MKIFIISVAFLLFLSGCGEAPSSDGDTPTPAPVVTQHSRNLLVVQINYNDINFVNPDIWADKIFGMREGELNHYYMQISKNQFRFLPISEKNGVINDGVATVRLYKNHPNPGNNFSLLHPDFKEALTLLDDDIDFSKYDTNLDSRISSKELLIVFIVAGNEEAYGPSTLPGVFAHQYCVDSSNTAYLDGVSLISCSGKGNYAVFGERHEDGARDATIGIIAHELGHAAFGLPDLYDTTPSTLPDSAGIGYFGLMGAGMWGTKEVFGAKEGSSPTHMSAWSKVKNGWIKPKVIESSQGLHVNLYASDLESFNIIKIPISTDKYYLLENRANSGYDRGLKAIDGIFRGGLALWRVDEDIISQNSASNSVNADKNSKGVDLVEATHEVLDTSAYEHGHEKNLFYYGNRDSYSDTFIKLEDISSRSEVMSAAVSKLR
jgi:M6 family metalloprotease-like protein